MTDTYSTEDTALDLQQPAPTTTAAATEEGGSAAEQAQGVATAATSAAQQVTAAASEEASRVAGEVAAQGRNLVEETKSQLHQQAAGQTERVSQSLRKLSDEARALSQGRADESGPLREYVEQAASQISTVAARIEERGFDGIVSDLQQFARRRPGAFLLGAAAAGFAAGRFIKAGRPQGGNSTAGVGTGPPVAALPPETPVAPAVAPAAGLASPGMPGVMSIQPPTPGIPGGSGGSGIVPPPAVPPASESDGEPAVQP